MISLNKYLTKTEKSLDFITKIESKIDNKLRGIFKKKMNTKV